MTSYGKLIEIDGEKCLTLLDMTPEEKEAYFPDWEKIETMDNLIFTGDEFMAKKKQTEEFEDAPKQEVETVLRDTDKQGNVALPGMEQEFKMIPELAEAIKENKELLVPQFMAAKKALEDSKQRIVNLAERYKDDLPLNEDGTKRKYNDGETWAEISVKDSVDFGMVAGAKE